MYSEDIAERRLEKTLVENAALVQRVYYFDRVLRDVCSELDVCYTSAGIGSEEIVAAIKKLKDS